MKTCTGTRTKAAASLKYQGETKTKINLQECGQKTPGCTLDESLPANAGDLGLIPGQEDSTCQGTTEPMPRLGGLGYSF